VAQVLPKGSTQALKSTKNSVAQTDFTREKAMFRRSSFLASVICIGLFLMPPVITLLLVVRQIPDAPKSFDQSTTAFSIPQKDEDLKQTSEDRVLLAPTASTNQNH
jgi:hypothetical protein